LDMRYPPKYGLIQIWFMYTEDISLLFHYTRGFLGESLLQPMQRQAYPAPYMELAYLLRYTQLLCRLPLAIEIVGDHHPYP
jgi:hypothetical protein